jgi:Polyketide cyclase / dehydrase and lipid transport
MTEASLDRVQGLGAIPGRSRRQLDRGVGPCGSLAQSGPLRRIGRTERLTEYTAGHSFAYELTEFTNVLRQLVDVMSGEWTFAPDGNGTVIRWTCEFGRVTVAIGSFDEGSRRCGAGTCGRASKRPPV